MQVAHSDVFSLKNSGLDAFLHADVGVEANGSTLTVLSILARLGKDPWAEATRWAALPKAAAIDSLAQSIAQMPLPPSALAGARDSAARLVQLLPESTRTLLQITAARPDAALPKWMPVTVLYFMLAVGMALSVMLMPKPSDKVPAVIDQPTSSSAPIHFATRSIPKGAAVAESPAVTPRP